ncbi:hypothetical protein [Bremerella sp. P1]|uniref:hypothetical protein n=1 Tax=Bremerella sp. P1 TaxID=3026424 RepID=UPI00236880B4|nr:hypothetical protein [Bremerella sp. P1]WDI41369.1 hypothetical protein PSR63_23145 [Bremerella sp. P1]
MPKRTMTRWNPVQLDFVEVDGLPSIFRLQRFAAGPPVSFDDEDRLDRITEVAQQLVDADTSLDVQGGKVAKLKPGEDWPPLACTFATHSLDAWANRMVFTCEEVDLTLATTMHQLGQAGDLSLVLPDTVGIFQESSTQTIPGLWQQQMNVKVLDSPKDVLALLKKSDKEQRQGRPPRAKKRFGDRHCEIPGLWPQRACAYFIELSADESPLDLFEAFTKFDQAWGKVNSDAGRVVVSRTTWTLETPTGDRYGAVNWAGQNALAMLKDFASKHDKQHGYVSNFSMLVVAGDTSYEIPACQLSEMKG